MGKGSTTMVSMVPGWLAPSKQHPCLYILECTLCLTAESIFNLINSDALGRDQGKGSKESKDLHVVRIQ